MSKLDELFKQAQAAFSKRDWTKAIQLLEKIKEWYSSYPGVDNLLAEIQKRQGAEAKYQTGQEHFESKRWKEAVEVFEEVVRDDPEHPGAPAKLKIAKQWVEIDRLQGEADAHWQNSEWEKAVETLELLLDLENSGLDFDWKSVSQRRDDAQEEFELQRIYQAGEWRFERRHWLVAQQKFEELKQRRLGYQDVDKKIKEIEKQLELDILCRQAEGHEQDGEWTQAINLYNRIYQRDQNYPDILNRIMHCREQQELVKVDEVSGIKKASKWRTWPWYVWFLLGFLLVVIIMLIFSCLLHCLLEYRVTETIVGLLVVLISSIVVNFIDLVSPDAQKIMRRFSGGAAFALLLCLLLALLSTPPTPEVCAQKIAIKLTPTPTLTMTPTTTTATSAPSNTPISELTKTLTTVLTPSSTPADTSVSTDTPPPTSTDTPTDTPTATFTPSPMPTATPTATFTPSPLLPTFTPTLYPSPELIGTEPLGCNVTFKWSWSGNLAEDEWFAVRVGTRDLHSVIWVKEREFTHSLIYGGEYCWQIAICRGIPGSGHCSGDEELAVSQPGVFQFGGCKPSPTPSNTPPKPTPP